MTHEPFDRAGTSDPTAKSSLARVLEPAIDETRIQSNWQQIVAARTPRRRRRTIPRWTVAVATTALAGIVIATIAWPGSSTPSASLDPSPSPSPAKLGPIASLDPQIAVTPGSIVDRPLSLDDGSHVHIDHGARLEVITNEPDRFVTLLRTGKAAFDVHPGGPRRWEIETSRATIEVVGTAFVIEASDQRVEVTVSRGVVVVRGERVPGRVVRLTAGQHVSVEDPTKAATLSRTPDAADRTPSPPPAPPAPPTSVDDLVPPSPAPRTAPRTGPSSATVPLLASADKLRAAGDPSGAAALLEKALASTTSAEPAGVVAFTLGRLYLDELDAPDRAAAAFARVIALAAPRSLLEDAYARRIEALSRGGHASQAHEALADYDRMYPHGVRRAALHALVK